MSQNHEDYDMLELHHLEEFHSACVTFLKERVPGYKESYEAWGDRARKNNKMVPDMEEVEIDL